MELPFWVVSEVDPGIGVLDEVHIPQGGEVWGYSGPLVLMAFWSSFIAKKLFDKCVKS